MNADKHFVLSVFIRVYLWPNCLFSVRYPVWPAPESNIKVMTNGANIVKRVFLVLVGATLSMGDSLPPFAFECSFLYRVSDPAKLGKPSTAVAFEVLRRVA